MKNKVQNSSKNEKESLKDIKWQKAIFHGRQMRKTFFRGAELTKNNI